MPGYEQPDDETPRAPEAPGAEPRDDDELPPADAEIAGSEAPQGTLSPSVRRLVRQYGLDVSELRGTGPGGRIRVADVMALLGGRDSGPPDEGEDAAAGTSPVVVADGPPSFPDAAHPARPDAAHPDLPDAADPALPDAVRALPDEPPAISSRPPAPLRAAPPPAGGAAPIAKPAGSAAPTPPGPATATAPGTITTTVFECDAGRILADRHRRRERGRAIALPAYFVAALARALAESRALPAQGGQRIPAIGVESPGGARVLANAGTLTLEQIAVALNAPVVAPQAPFVAIRDHGDAGSLLVQSERLAPEHLAVLGIGRIARRVVVRSIEGEEALKIASQCLLTLSFRADDTDLAAANDLLGRCVAQIERWGASDEAR